MNQKDKPASYSHMLTTTIAGVLKEEGFKREGVHFLRIRDGFREDIYIQRSRWNVAGWPSEIYVNIYIFTGDGKIVLHSRVPNIPPRPKPERFEQYYADISIEARSDFTDEEINEIHAYQESLRWLYNGPEELASLLGRAGSLLESKGLMLVDLVEKRLQEQKTLTVEEVAAMERTAYDPA